MRIRIERPTTGIMGVSRWRIWLESGMSRMVIGKNVDRIKALKQAERRLHSLLNSVSKKLDP